MAVPTKPLMEETPFAPTGPKTAFETRRQFCFSFVPSFLSQSFSTFHPSFPSPIYTFTSCFPFFHLQGIPMGGQFCKQYVGRVIVHK